MACKVVEAAEMLNEVGCLTGRSTALRDCERVGLKGNPSLDSLSTSPLSRVNLQLLFIIFW